MSLDSRLADRLIASPRVRLSAAHFALPDCPGHYALFVDGAAALPSPFDSELRERGTEVLYVGMAVRSIRDCFLDHEANPVAPSSLISTLGAMLGYRVRPGVPQGEGHGTDFTFCPADNHAIAEWAFEHLSVAWASDVPSLEDRRGAVVTLAPLLNLSGNPHASSALKKARARCRRLARGEARRASDTSRDRSAASVRVVRQSSSREPAPPKSKKSAARQFSVYVIELQPSVLGNKKFASENGGYIEVQPCVYVGSTSRTPEERFEQHKRGHKANKFARRYGVCLRPEDYEQYNPMATRDEAEQREVLLANELRRQGYAVWYGV